MITVLRTETSAEVSNGMLASTLSMCIPPAQLDAMVGQVLHYKTKLNLPTVCQSDAELAWQEHGMSYSAFCENSAAYMAYVRGAQYQDVIQSALCMCMFHCVIPEIAPELRSLSRLSQAPTIEYTAQKMYMNLNGIFAGACRQCNDQDTVRVSLSMFISRFKVSETEAGKAALWRFCVAEQFRLGSLFGKSIA
jgi:hypothetical protein